VASDSDEFANLLLTLAKKWPQCLEHTVRNVHHVTEMALRLYKRLKIKDGQGLIAPVASILQEIGRRDRNKLFRMLDFSSSDPLPDNGSDRGPSHAKFWAKIM
jgi:hypothetical protein